MRKASALETEDSAHKKRVATTNDGYLDQERIRPWAGLSPELLASIFVRILPVDAMIRAVPHVCSAWRDAVNGPDCWAHIDLEQWCRRVADSGAVDTAVGNLVRRSSGTLTGLSVYKMGNPGFFCACSSGSFLRVLKMPMSEVTDEMVEKHAEALSKLTTLDISYCLKITSKGILVLGKYCKSLVELRRNMPFLSYRIRNGYNADTKVDELEAMAIANNMLAIEHLELAYGSFSSQGLNAILSNCGSLRNLDIGGCWNCMGDGDIVNKLNLVQSVRFPYETDFEHYEEVDSTDDEGDSGGDTGFYCSCGLDEDTSDDSGYGYEFYN